VTPLVGLIYATSMALACVGPFAYWALVSAYKALRRCSAPDGRGQCDGRRSRLCMDDLCVHHCREYHKESGCPR
jgi:hypothetical protein